MKTNSNIIINSSVFLAYISFLGWSVAYIYGWAKFYYYNYPWEFIEVGINNIARALGYILFVSMIIFITCAIGLIVIRSAKQLFPSTMVASIRTFVVLSVVFTPLLVQISLITREPDYVIISIYLLGAIAISILCKKHSYHISIKKIIRDIKNHKIHLLTALTIVYFYFALSAFMIGYYAQIFPKTYAQITLFEEDYYIFGKSNDTLILIQELGKDNTGFFIYPCVNNIKPCKVTIKN
ncbi:hypothetical protein BKG95_02510 [Rodentibacter pneumotropicus]|uniref:Uncharacterized protein n=2 Tax=Rodentibacter pneumotropicus TaxID=758 RepID=A0AAW5LAB9_9PAST|nr:hypothetical protein [Rodentibacter pneumotropicus]MCQ9120988.1 hypothetical protein [Rodentibacter pneumotropicus]OOF69157.1 hypothetical protein BKG95_02510 [Rodentibacter pneumotropicus]